MGKIAVVGDEETVVGFSLAGVQVLHVHRQKKETLERIRALLSDPSVTLLMITSSVREELGPELELLVREKRLFPLLLTIPDHRGYFPAVDELERLVRRTAGVQVVIG